LLLPLPSKEIVGILLKKLDMSKPSMNQKFKKVVLRTLIVCFAKYFFYNPNMEDLKKVALLMSKNIGYNRDVIEGIYAYSQKRKNWIFHDAAPLEDSLDWLQEWKPDGLICHLYDDVLAEKVKELEIPVVNTTDSLAHLNYPLADVNHFHVGRMAGEYLLGLGVEQFGYLGSAKLQYSKQRLLGFKEIVGSGVAICNVEYQPRISDLKNLKEMLDRIDKWVRGLKKPVGVFCSNDVPARDLADQCLATGIKVPEEVAIVGVDNDLVECRLSRPPLSSIEIPSARIGYGAAQMLDAMLSGEIEECSKVFNPPPVRVVERGSSNVDVVEDEVVRKALIFIREHFATLEGVDEVVDQVGLGRRALELRFRKVLKASILEKIHEKRVWSSKDLLVNGSSSIEEISALCGYQSSRRFSRLFKESEGLSPAEYRKQRSISVMP